MNRLRRYFIGELLKMEGFLERARVLVVFNITIYSIILTFFLFCIVILEGEYLIAARAMLSILLLIGFLYITKSTQSIKPLSHFIVNIAGFAILSNLYFIFQRVDYSTFSILLALMVFSFEIFPRKTSSAYAIFYSMNLLIVVFLNAYEIKWTTIEPFQFQPFDQLLATLTGLILIFYILWEFDRTNSDFAKHLKLQNKELTMAKSSAEEMIKLKNNFLANMSHEFRTPLNGIIGIAEIIESEIEKDEIKELAFRQKESSKRLLNTLNNIMELSKLESHNKKLVLQDIDIKRFLNELFPRIKYEAELKGLDFEIIVPNYELTGRASLEPLNAILLSVLDNAIKFTQSGQIRVNTYQENEQIVIEISDTGIGISKEFLPKIFNTFEQESVGIGRTYEGSGIGLSISKKYMEMIGGALNVESVKGEGSVFYIIIPASKLS